jgi:hypothetical protein
VTFAARTDAIEEAYEFFLAYASQGLTTESGAGHQVRDYLGKFDAALGGLAEILTAHIDALRLDAAAYRGFVGVIDRDAKDTQAAIRMVLAQPSITSQIVDNLNASIHVRALLTDLFLIDEILQVHMKSITTEGTE